MHSRFWCSDTRQLSMHALHHSTALSESPADTPEHPKEHNNSGTISTKSIT